VRVLTDGAHNKARILEIDESNIRRDLKDGMSPSWPASRCGSQRQRHDSRRGG